MWLDKRSMNKTSDTATVTDVRNLQRSRDRDSQSLWDISVRKSNVKTSSTWKVEEEEWREAKPKDSENSEEDVCSR